MSWVETTCPPGWWIDTWNDGIELWWCDREGSRRLLKAWGRSVPVFRRLAWERWALDVLGDRIVWLDDSYHTPIIGVALPRSGMGRVTVTMVWSGWAIEHGGVDQTCSDPVEALARLAALVLALEGPDQ